jgi:flagellar assembly protein FliH
MDKIDSGRIEVFEYPASLGAPPLTEWTGWANVEDAEREPAKTEEVHATGVAASRMSAEMEILLAEEKRRALEAGHEQGRLAEREAQAESLVAAERRRLHQAAEFLESFGEEREQYMVAVEREVVKLALAVAARILRREAQMDPLLLTGAVRVALGQLSSSTQVRLRVPPAELNLWTEAMALLPNLAMKPVVMAGEEMRLGDCVLETELGSADFGDSRPTGRN